MSAGGGGQLGLGGALFADSASEPSSSDASPARALPSGEAHHVGGGGVESAHHAGGGGVESAAASSGVELAGHQVGGPLAAGLMRFSIGMSADHAGGGGTTSFSVELDVTNSMEVASKLGGALTP